MLETPGSSSELLPWLFLANDNIVVTKDGGLMACLKIDAMFSDNMTSENKNFIAECRQRAIDTFRDINVSTWWSFHKQLDCEYPEYNFPEVISAMIDDARKDFFNKNPHYHISSYCSIVLYPSMGINKFVNQFHFFYKKKKLSLASSIVKSIFCYFGENAVFPYLEQEMNDEISRFELLIDKFTSCLHGFSVHRLNNSDRSLGAFLYHSANPCNKRPSLAIPTENWLIDSFITDNEISLKDDHLVFKGNNGLKKYASAITVKLATENSSHTFTSPDISLTDIFSVPAEMAISFCFRNLSNQHTSRYIRNMKRWYSYRMYSWKAYLSAALLQSDIQESSSIKSKKQLFDQCNELQYQIDSSQIIMGYSNISIIVYSDTNRSLLQKKKSLFESLSRSNFIFIDETNHLLSSWMVTQPGMHNSCCRWSIISSANIADNLPIISNSNKHNKQSPHLLKITKGEPISFLSGEYQQKIAVHPYVDDNGHYFIIGPTGSGKSLFANLQMSQFRKYRGASIFVLDYDQSSKIPILLQDGIYIDPEEDKYKKLALNPFSLLSDKSSWPWLRDWIFSLMGDNENLLKNQYADEIEITIESMSYLEKSNWNIHTLYCHITSESLRVRLHQWINKEFYGKWLGTGPDIFDMSLDKKQLIGLEMKPLIKASFNSAPLIEYILYRIENHLSKKQHQYTITPSVVHIAECWNFLSNPLLMNRVATWLKTFRKYLCSVWMDTQSIEDLFSSDIFPSIRDNIASRVFLPNHKAKSESVKNLYMHEFGLNEEEINYLSYSQPKKELLIVQGDTSFRASLVIDNKLTLLLSSDLKQRQRLEHCIRTDCHKWKDLYLCNQDM
ncbi:VirB4 family type IV secretion system protein [Candidatus Ichthyocystis sparus]|uniref:VirB4 family type IV secretion system protein n=1 Tax=Candidatus Ichthyocystis sparus TaxID=1561004 RepID=UPI000B888D98|nr:VirB4 family type IV secretion system protein [Candidatus Ichthyocystis sparus]